MKIAINAKPYDGPWGGGNRFVAAIWECFKKQDWQVIDNLSDADIDFIIMVDPRVRSPNIGFGPGDIWNYLQFRNPNALVFHRINECDERKGEKFINARLAHANKVADYTVFIADWLRHLPIWQQHLRTDYSIIYNGADQNIFHSDGFVPWNGQEPLKLVTHHWGAHWMKGFDVYSHIDDLLKQLKWQDKLSLTYIGNLPKNFEFKHVTYYPACDGMELANLIKAHHGYLTASINEPGGMHQHEGGCCGLPLLYRNSGAFPETCAPYGVYFNGVDDFEDAFDRYKAHYSYLLPEMASYKQTAALMTQNWVDLLERLYPQKEEIIARRKLWSPLLSVIRNQIIF